ncbi:MAG: hypothetical protein E7547_02290 [Ruminococcaceae bacterium]|nr:hypothetical protein [Oscillospiraceae bacterium]
MTNIGQKYCRDERLGAASITLYFFLLKFRRCLWQMQAVLEQVNSRDMLLMLRYRNFKPNEEQRKRTIRKDGSFCWRPKQDSNL